MPLKSQDQISGETMESAKI